MAKKDMYNSSGCLDMTVFLAMRNIEREEIERRRAGQSGKKMKRRKTKRHSTKNPT